MIEIPIDRHSEIPLYHQIALHLERMIRTGALVEGIKLPGTRELASSLGISRTTVLRAYEALEVRDFIIQRGRSGAYVSWPCTKDFSSVSIDSGLLDLSSGSPSGELVPSAVLSRLSRDLLLEHGEDVLKSAPVCGLSELRQTLVTHAVSRGIPAYWKEVMVTSGGLESLSLSMTVLKQLGVKRIFMEELTYPEAYLIARDLDLEIRPVVPESELLDAALNDLSDKDAVYLVPSFQNPTGRTLSQNIRGKFLEYSVSRGFWILEDDAYGELRYGEYSVPALKAMNGSEKVIYSGSFSQPLFPGLRLGYSLVPERLMENFVEIQSRRSGPVSSLVQRLVLEFIKRGFFSQAVETARATIQGRMYGLVEFIQEYLPFCKFITPSGGIYLWLETPGLDGDHAEKKALESGVSLSSGNKFSWSGKRVEAVRLSVSSLNRMDIRNAVKSISKAWSR